VFAKDVSPAQAAAMAAAQKRISASAFTASVPQAAWKTIPSWYLVATEDHALNLDLQRLYATRIGFTEENAVGASNWLLMFCTSGPSFSVSVKVAFHSGRRGMRLSASRAQPWCPRQAYR
jgi:hypothetical protein